MKKVKASEKTLFQETQENLTKKDLSDIQQKYKDMYLNLKNKLGIKPNETQFNFVVEYDRRFGTVPSDKEIFIVNYLS